MPTQHKIDQTRQLREIAERHRTILVVGYRGMKVKDMETLREVLRGPGATMRVVKNSLLRRAIAGTQAEGLADSVEGPCALVYGGEPAEVAKVLANAVAQRSPLQLLGGLVEGKPAPGAAIEALARIPPRDQLLSMLVAGLQGPMSSLVQVLGGVISQLVFALDEVRAKKEAA